MSTLATTLPAGWISFIWTGSVLFAYALGKASGKAGRK